MQDIYTSSVQAYQETGAAAAEEENALRQDPLLKAAQDFKPLRDLICRAYVYEYLSFYDEDAPGAWADRLNTYLDAYKDDPAFAFLRQTTVNETTGEEEIEYKRVDPSKYQDFKAKQFTLWGGTEAEKLFDAIKDLVGNHPETLNTFINFPNEVLLHQNLQPMTGVGDVEALGFGGNVEYLLGYPTDIMEGTNSPRIAGIDMLLFALFSAQTGWFTKDQAQNAPFTFGGSRYLKGSYRDEVTQGELATARYNEYLPYLIPAKDGTTSTDPANPAAGLRWNDPANVQTDYKQAVLTSGQLRVPGGRNTPNPNPSQDDYLGASRNDVSISGILNTFTFEELQDIGVTQGDATEGLVAWVKGLFDSDSPSRDDLLFYQAGGTPSEDNNAFLGIYAYNLEVISSIGTLYPQVTLNIFKDVLLNFVNEVQENLDSAAAVLGAQEDQLTTPFESLPRPTKEALKPVEHQCYLLENIRTLADYKDTVTVANKYDHIGAIYNNGNGRNTLPGNLISYINHANKTEEVNALLNLCPDVYALLTPHIKIYRVDYKTDDKLVPFKEQEIPFPNFIDPSDIEALMNNDYGRFPGAGIKSFSWNLDGVNPAEVANNISAQLSLHFQTIQDLFSLNQGLAAGQDKAGYLDLIIKSAGASDRDEPPPPQQAPPNRDVSAECFEAEMLDYDPRDFEIKACVGWSTPPNFAQIVNEMSTSRERGPDYGKQLQAAINSTRLALFLTITTHELTFNENGSVDLVVNYQARLSGLARSPAADIFAGGTTLQNDLADVDSKLENINKQLKREMESSNVPEEGSNDAVEGLRAQKKALLEDKAKLVRQDKAIKYKRFLNKLYDDNKIYAYHVAPTDRQLLRDMSPEQRATAATQRVQSDEYQMGYNPQSDAGAVDSLYQRAATQIESISGRNITDDGEVAAAALLKVNTIEEQYGDGSMSIPFMYLGDLIDGVLSYLDTIIDSDKSRGSLQLILSQVELLDPLLAYQIQALEIECPNNKSKRILKALTEIDPMRFRGLTGIKFTTGIGSLPISLEFFQEWFINNIVRAQVENYSLLRFVKNICSSLIAKAFNSLCFKEGVNFSLRFDTSNFNFDKSYTGKIVTTQQLADSKRSADESDCQRLTEDRKPSIPSFVLYSVDSRPLTGNYDDDLATGIYHYYLGAACGIAKKINFERINIPFYREARLGRTSELSALQLREMYNANIDMVGNNLHKNGQYIYVNPIAIGAGSLKTKGSLPSLARLLGIGGYYMISRVTHKVSSAGFDVNIQAIQEGVDFSATGNAATQLIPYSDGGLLNPRDSGA